MSFVVMRGGMPRLHDNVDPPLRLRPRRSKWLLAWMLGLWGMGIATVSALPLPLWQRGGLVLLATGLLIHEVRLHYLRVGREAVTAAGWSGEGGWSVTTADGTTRAATLLPGSWCHPRLVVLVFRLGGWRRYPLVLPVDSLDEETARRLRRLLRKLSRSSAEKVAHSTASGGT